MGNASPPSPPVVKPKAECLATAALVCSLVVPPIGMLLSRIVGQDSLVLPFLAVACSVLAASVGLILGLVALVSGTTKKSFALMGVIVSIPMVVWLAPALALRIHVPPGRTICKAQLSGLGKAAVLYHAEHNAYPPSLDVLMKRRSRDPTKAFSARGKYWNSCNRNAK